MWMLQNNSPFAAERGWVRDKNGAEVWLVAIKGLFDIQDNGQLTLSTPQEPVNRAPVFRDPDAPSSLLYDTDLPQMKLGTDVLLDGHAHGPDGRAVNYIDVQLRVENLINKRLRVFGDRQWVDQRGRFRLSEPLPFQQMPLIWERAFGGTRHDPEDVRRNGWEPRNPVGSGFATYIGQVAKLSAPNIERVDTLISDWRERPAPANFGPIAGHWAPRVQRAGTYDGAWEKQRQPLLPLDFDPAFFHCAPDDQHIPGFLKGGEQVECLNLSPFGALAFRVPRVSLIVETQFKDRHSVKQRPVIHTVNIKSDVAQVAVVWHIHLPCHKDVMNLTKAIIHFKPRVDIGKQGRVARDHY